MFLGEFAHNLDDKGRITLPSRWRDALGERVVVTRGIEPCLLVFPETGFESYLKEIATVSLKADTRGLSRFFSGKATDDVPDRQGRITVPLALRQFAGLNGEVMLVGAYDHVELWNPARYAEVNAELEKSVSEMSERIGDALQRLREKG